MKVSVSKVAVRGQTKWMVRWKPPGAPKATRHYHNTKKEAETEQQTVQAQTSQARDAWAAWPAEKRNEIVALAAEAEHRGYTLQAATEFYWANRDLAHTDTTQLRALVQEAHLAGVELRQAFDFYQAHRDIAESTMKVGEAYRLFMTEMESRLIGKKGMEGYRYIVGKFLDPRKDVPVSSVTRDDCMNWLTDGNRSPSTFNSYLASLHTFFKWCADTGKIKKAPTATIEKINKRRMPNHDQAPVFLSLIQVGRLLKATLEKQPGLIPYVTVGLFGGLRPDSEASKLPACDVGVSEGKVLVRGTNAKDRQRRYVTIHPTLKAWLDLGGDYAMLFKHYRALVKADEAAKFWEITPDVIENNRLQEIIDRPAPAGSCRQNELGGLKSMRMAGGPTRRTRSKRA
jgi:integrase